LIALELYKIFLRDGFVGAGREADAALAEAAIEHAAAQTAAAGQQDATRAAAMLYNTAYVLASQGHAEAAIEKYRACLARNPHYAAARLNLGVLLYQANRPAEALDAFSTVLDYEPDNQQARVSRGWALLALGRYAVEVFREATRHDPRDPQAWHGLGVALKAQTDRLEEAADALRKAVALEPNHAESHCALGEALLRLERPSQAASSFARCVDLAPEQAASRAWLGFALELLGEREKAIGAYRGSLSLDPRNRYALQGLERLAGREALTGAQSTRSPSPEP
jgi:tetratricopeptide (TPR) repeat protein